MNENLFPDDLFYRVHRSYMVNTGKVATIYGDTIIIEGQEIPIGSNYKLPRRTLLEAEHQ